MSPEGTRAGANTVTVTQTIATPNTFNTLFKLSTGGNDTRWVSTMGTSAGPAGVS